MELQLWFQRHREVARSSSARPVSSSAGAWWRQGEDGLLQTQFLLARRRGWGCRAGTPLTLTQVLGRPLLYILLLLLFFLLTLSPCLAGGEDDLCPVTAALGGQ